MSKILSASQGNRRVMNLHTYQEFQIQDRAVGKEHENVHTVEGFVEESLRQAETIINTAREEAEKIRQQALEEGRKQGIEQGRQEGIEKACEEHRKTLEEKVAVLEKQITHYVEDVKIEKEKVMEQYMDDLKNIALAVGEKIIQTSLRSSGEVVGRMIAAATEKLKKTAWAKIYVGKGSEPVKVHGDSKLLQELSNLSDNVKIILMDEEEPGTCIIELPDEIIDISVGTQLENIKDILNNARV